MTYDTQGRRVLHGHPSTWQQEVEQLRAENQELALQVLASEGQADEAYKAQQQAEARVQELEAALTRIKNYTGHPSATTQAERNVFAWARDALIATHSAALQKQEGE